VRVATEHNVHYANNHLILMEITDAQISFIRVPQLRAGTTPAMNGRIRARRAVTRRQLFAARPFA
jgi:hypothetical protein